ncbi:unnamed protein product [Euphydryas editha]|uniref:Uncharacterized protein n=1 Tax=Euphydryas editha TaxID=104508 RepID=A0AAU9VAY4_EUPED|nr:unnamed protein product [Euphydryas editha]
MSGVRHAGGRRVPGSQRRRAVARRDGAGAARGGRALAGQWRSADHCSRPARVCAGRRSEVRGGAAAVNHARCQLPAGHRPAARRPQLTGRRDRGSN